MRLENTGIDDMLVDVKPLSYIMGNHAFIKGEQWDYERITYDYKVGSEEKGVTYYIRIHGYAVEGDVDRGNAVVKLLTTILGNHYYPHVIVSDEEQNLPK